MPLHVYQDRKRLKWDNGFMISEHTAMMANEKKEREFIWPAKELMTKDEIDRILYEAKLKNRAVAIQKEEMNEEGLYSPDVTGKIQGYDELGVFISGQKVDYDEIRSVEFFEEKKWSDLS
ncbi:hypothetical protein [Enterococcus sp. JM9B]|uniref:hypothetical protein n=1 Tax=Enterococcus sp. JM9B TaxID=1857216 RepID=UPI00137506C2|nr:hypothetical protein [Enterococcus sp. JM9B]KAF1303652.1 hypothetical protein BAU16_03550 [Enterococcus sp. JM9B]